MTRRTSSLLALLGAALCALALASPAGAARDLQVGFADDQFGDDLLTSTNSSVRDQWFDNLVGTNAGLARINVYWNQTAGEEPASPTNPADPSYDWSVTDAAVIDARQRGLDVVLTVLGAPRWAEGPNRDPDFRVGTWKPDADKFGGFARAIARRYSGSYSAPDVGPLPRVDNYEAWNEPNLPNYISPQWNGKKPASPDIYRDLLNAFYEGVHAINPRSVVVAAGTSPFGDEPGGKRMRPYYFWREVFCLRKNLKEKKKCSKSEDPALMDRFAHNPINAVAGDGPQTKPGHPDDGVPSNFNKLRKIVRKAEKAGTVKPPGKRAGWATETWYESKPPEKKAVSLKKQAQFQQEVQYVLWKGGAETVIFLQLRDSPYDPSSPALIGFQTGVYFLDGKSKPSLRAVQFPFVADRKSKKKVILWGKAPESGKLKVINKKAKRKKDRKVAKIKVKAGEVFKTKVKIKGKAKLEAKVGSEKSLTWKLGRK